MEDNRKLICIPKRIHSKEIEVFQVYADSIAGILGDSTFKEYEIIIQDLELDLPYGNDIWDYLKNHERTFKYFTVRYLEIKELDGDVEKIVLRNNQYQKYINGLKKKKIGRVRDESVLDSDDKVYWNRQILFKEVIEKNLIKEYKTEKGRYTYTYTTVDDVLNFFAGEIESKSNQGKDVYNKFQNSNGDYDFTISKDSIAKYINSIERFFQKKRVRYNGSRLNIYTLVNDDITL